MTTYKNKNPLQLRTFCLGMLLTFGLGTAAQAEVKSFQIHGETTPLAGNGIHDPENDAIEVFQHPTTAMKDFPRDTVGVIDWVKTLEEGKLIARANRLGTEKKETFDLDIIRTNTGEMPNVTFSHAKHSTQMDCKSCHSGLFEKKSNATEITMSAILTGDKCGVCHGKVAFPPTNNCMRCHNVTP
ncbi:Putative cytochrome c [hydrothermal vent metagenome]|uniref:Cytochrome c n=1 Tax=hydrothermal vent metagenome TaxID=652676 RepID=A0A3B0YTC6_9ZZZZ